MILFIVRRLLLAALVCLTVLVVSFILTRLSGDLAASIAGPNASAADIAIITRNYGLDRPLVVQFLDWAGHAAEGDLGRSFLYHVPVWGLIRDRLPVTLTLGLTGLSIALLVALPLGILAAVREGSAMDRGIMMVALLGQAMPGFWFGLVMIVLLGLELQWLPISGVETWQGYIMPGIFGDPGADAPDPLGNDRRIGSGLYSHRAREGVKPAEDHPQARLAQCGDAGGLDRGRAAWLHVGRVRGD
jgi:ABC-type dipeptide/oligopeptide/nickel transport system permease component